MPQLPIHSTPLSAQDVVHAAQRYHELRADGDTLYWLTPAEQGQMRLVRLQHEQESIVADHHVRSRVHEYGGGAYAVQQGKIAYVTADGSLYLSLPNRDATVLYLPQAGERFADLTFSTDGQWLYAVRETPDQTAVHALPENDLVRIHLRDAALEVVHRGQDFYACPRPSPDGLSLAFISWNHPDMPWDRTTLWVADTTLQQIQPITSGTDSIADPQWSPHNELYFASDVSGWWNLYRYQAGEIRAILPMEAEFARPAWIFGQHQYAFLDARTLIVSYTQQAKWFVARLRCGGEGKDVSELTVLAEFADVSDVVAADQGAYLIAATSTQLAAVWQATAEQVCPYLPPPTSPLTVISEAESIWFESEGDRVHGFYYPPSTPTNKMPPLRVIAHGGPTACASSALNLNIQYWTSRGFAVLDVNYRGSTGFGKAYRQQLDGAWGVRDVADCVAGAQYLVQQHRADVRRLTIRGGSAGGLTVLNALVLHDVFCAAAVYYGVADLALLVAETHKFEAHYLTRLIGDTLEQIPQIYRDRSPLFAADQIRCPVIFFQGLLDKVVPPEQTQAMYNAVHQRNSQSEVYWFDQEAHGFRNKETVVQCLEAEYAFYSQNT